MTAHRTYLPVFTDVQARERWLGPSLPSGEISQDVSCAFERVGIDRLLAILIDLPQRGLHAGSHILDIGASSGLFSHALVDRGFHVTAVENNVAAQVHAVYPESPTEILSHHVPLAGAGRLQVVARDVVDFVAEGGEQFDGCLLLSVVHQMYAGYSLTPSGRRSFECLTGWLRALVSRIRCGIYYEFPESEPVNEILGDFSTPQWFLRHTEVRSVEWICTSASADGDPRPLYFLNTKR